MSFSLPFIEYESFFEGIDEIESFDNITVYGMPKKIPEDYTDKIKEHIARIKKYLTKLRNTTFRIKIRSLIEKIIELKDVSKLDKVLAIEWLIDEARFDEESNINEYVFDGILCNRSDAWSIPIQPDIKLIKIITYYFPQKDDEKIYQLLKEHKFDRRFFMDVEEAWYKILISSGLVLTGYSPTRYANLLLGKKKIEKLKELYTLSNFPK